MTLSFLRNSLLFRIQTLRSNKAAVNLIDNIGQCLRETTTFENSIFYAHVFNLSESRL